MKLIGNIIWLLLGGIAMGLTWLFIGVIAFVSIVGIPWGRACFNIGLFSLFPFGKEAISREYVNGEADIGTGFLGVIGNMIWFFLAGFWLAVGHLISAIACFITIIGIPFGLQHIKLIPISLMPIGKCVVDTQ